MKRKVLLFMGIAMVAVMAYMGVRTYNAKMPGASGHPAEVAIRATGLYEAFEADEVEAGHLYNDKLVEVTGMVRDVSYDEGRMTVTLGPDSSSGSVVCEFTAMGSAPSKGSMVTIKGYCAGFNFDVLLQRCAFVEGTE